jgi:hypothetical protein
MISQIDTTAARKPITLGEIEGLTARLADASNALDEQLAVYEQELQAVNDKHLRPLKRLATIVAQAEAELHGTIESAPHLFGKPRTLSIHGIKVGFSVSEGKLVFEDEPLVIKLLKKKFPELEETLISRTEKVNKDAVKSLGLSDEELKRLGMRIEERGDKVLIKRDAGEIEKLLTKLKTKLVEAIVEAA